MLKQRDEDNRRHEEDMRRRGEELQILQAQREEDMLRLQAQQKEEMRLMQEQFQTLVAKLTSGNSSSAATANVSTPSFSPFDSTSELWDDYYARFRTFVGAHSVPTDRVAQVFLTNQSATTYKLLDNLAKQATPPKQINNLTMDEIVAFMKDQYDPKRFVVRERFKFWSDMNRKPGETLQELAARIRQDATTCDFTSIKDPQDEALRTRFICSVKNEAILKALFKVKDDELTFTKAIEIATETEDAAKVAKETVQGSLPKTVNKVKHTQKPKHKAAASSHSNSEKKKVTCFRCGNPDHKSPDCKIKDAVCSYCNRKGHLEVVCQKKKSKPVKHIYVKSVNMPMCPDTLPKIKEVIEIDGKELQMEVDTGTAHNFISLDYWNALGKPKLEKSQTEYESASKHDLPVKGTFFAVTKLPGSEVTHTVRFQVTPVADLNLLGRFTTHQLGISVDEALKKAESECNVVFDHLPVDRHLLKQCHKLCKEFPDLWKPELGCLRDVELEVEFKPDSQPVFMKARPVPFAIAEDLEEAYDSGIQRGIWEPVQFNDYGTPVVPIRKTTLPGQGKSKLRVCGDYSVTVNEQLKEHRHPLPLPEDLMRKLGGGHGFTKIDLADAYNQIKLGPQSQRKLALNTHRGVLLQKRLPFGIKSAPGYFQQVMDQLTNDLPGVAVYLDDILVSGKDSDDHLANLQRLLQRLDEKGLRCRLEKCSFAQPYVEYLGHLLSKEGIAKGPKVDAVIAMPPPTDVSGLKAFLGSVQFYAKFLPSHLATVVEPLHRLTRKNTPWQWEDEQQKAFDQLKNWLSSDNVLVHFDSTLPIGLACDASNVGIGAVLFHRYPDGSERPIFNVSKKLTNAQRNYSQIQKEALSIVFGLKKFYQYLYGRKFHLVTDHRPLLAMFGPSKPTPALAANRLARWALLLSQFDYTVEYRRTNDHGNADALSRLPMKNADIHFDGEEDEDDQQMVCVINDVDEKLSPANHGSLARESALDAIISKVLRFTREGWPPSKNDEGCEMQRYRKIADSLSCVNGCLVHGSRVVIPASLRRMVLEQLHLGHFGMQRMKQLARTSVYWPNIDLDIEATCRSCTSCAEHQNKPSKPANHPWMLPEKPWSRLHLDHAINFLGSNWLVLIDAYSKYPCIHPTQSITTKATIDLLESDFAHFGYPHTLVTDNATTFMSGEFQEWCKDKGITHLTGAPYHPETNGAAERLVQTFKQSLKKSSHPPKKALNEFLMQYRRTPNSTGYSPSELLNSRQIRTKIDTLLPIPAYIAQGKQSKEASKSQAVAHVVTNYKPGDTVYALYFGPRRDKAPRWVPAVVVKRKGTRTVNVRVWPRGPTWRRHVDQLQPRFATPEDLEPGDDCVSSEECDFEVSAESVDTGSSSTDTASNSSVSASQPTLRRSARSTKGIPPLRYSP